MTCINVCAVEGRQKHRNRQTGATMSDVVVGVLMAALGLVGLFMAAGAMDNEIYLFGLSLGGFAAVFLIGLVKAYYDRLEAARERAQ